jgi:hypothetical protein
LGRISMFHSGDLTARELSLSVVPVRHPSRRGHGRWAPTIVPLVLRHTPRSSARMVQNWSKRWVLDDHIRK